MLGCMEIPLSVDQTFLLATAGVGWRAIYCSHGSRVLACFRIFLAAFTVVFWHGSACSWGLAEEAVVVKAVGPHGQPIDLPPAPQRFAKLIESGNVSLSFYDPAEVKRQYAGETKLDLRYDYRSSSRWDAQREGDGHVVTVRSQFRQFKFTRRHTIVLPIRMAGENFYSRPLVEHEFDHVRISTNPAFEKQFQRWIEAELRVLKLTLPAGQTLDNQWVQAQIKAAMKQRFDRLLDLIQIRYRELDRVTDHGMTPLPMDFFATESSP